MLKHVSGRTRLSILVIVGYCTLWPAVGGAAEIADSARTVLLTHPRASVLNYYVRLVQDGILAIPQLHIRGIYHAAETEDYRDAYAYLERENIDWISLERLDCPLPMADVYQANACSSAFYELAEQSAALIVSGGPDIPPDLYDAAALPFTLACTPARHTFEVSLLYHLLGRGAADATSAPIEAVLTQRPDYVILGLCGGMQGLNVAGGGTLTQDIPSQIYAHAPCPCGGETPPASVPDAHQGDARSGPGAGVYHPIKLSDSAPVALRQFIGGADGMAHVLSIHHQAISQVSEDYEVTAHSLDRKVIEGIRHKQYRHVFGWQFHPELPALWDGTADPARTNARQFARCLWTTFAQQVQQIGGLSEAAAK